MKLKPNPDLQMLAKTHRAQEEVWPGRRKERLAVEKETRRKARNRRKAGKPW